MKRLFTSSRWLVLLAVSFALSPGSYAETELAVSTIQVDGPESTFINDLGYGKDPFYPKSVRRGAVVPKIRHPIVRQGVPDWIELGGVSFNKDRKLAIINNRTVAEGESFSVKHSDSATKTKVTVVTINETGVIVEVNGARKTLLLRESLR